MSLEQNIPQVSGPLVDRDGIITQAWWAFFRNLWERTGGSGGVSAGDLELLATLGGASGPGPDAQARADAQSAFLAALRPVRQPIDYTEPDLFALMLLGPLTASIQAAAASGVISFNTRTGAVTFLASDIPNDSVTYARMQDVSAASRLIGRGSASGAGDPEEITLGTGLTMTGTSLSATGGGVGGLVPITAGVEPIQLISDGQGQCIMGLA